MFLEFCLNVNYNSLKFVSCNIHFDLFQYFNYTDVSSTAMCFIGA